MSRPRSGGLPTGFTNISLNQKMEHSVALNQKRKAENLTQERLEELWKKLIARSKDDDKLLELLNDKKLQVDSDNSFTIFVTNSYLTAYFAQYQKTILTFLRGELANDDIRYDVKVVEDENHELKLYLPNEKYEDMAKRNPSLVTLRRVFKDIDF
ncbi:MAG: hypothetical protein K5864_08425 [Bacteroidales bacterium]|nr:hypothetical protein [Bacteroidales bacterium]